MRGSLTALTLVAGLLVACGGQATTSPPSGTPASSAPAASVPASTPLAVATLMPFTTPAPTEPPSAAPTPACPDQTGGNGEQGRGVHPAALQQRDCHDHQQGVEPLRRLDP